MNATHEVDLTGLKCPMPIVELTKLMKQLDAGEEVSAIAKDPAFCLDVEAWCNRTGHELLQLEDTGDCVTALIRKKTERSPEE